MRRWEWLTELVKLNDWQAGAELGVKEGQTLFYLLDHCPKLWMVGVDIWGLQPDRIVDYPYNDWPHRRHETKVREKARDYRGQIRILKMLTVEAAHYIKNYTLDFVFIDADHSTEAVKADILAWMPKLRPQNGILCGHDAGKPTVVNALNEVLPGWKYWPQHDKCWSYGKSEYPD